MPPTASSRYWYCASLISNLSLLAYCLWGSASSCRPHLSHSNTLQLTSHQTQHHSLIWAPSTESQCRFKHQLITRGVTDTFVLLNYRICTTIWFYTYSIYACVYGYRNMYIYTIFEYIFGLATSANNTSCSKIFKYTSRHDMKKITLYLFSKCI